MSVRIFTVLHKNYISVLLTVVCCNLISLLAVGYKMDFYDLNSDLKELYLKLNGIGCCKTCCLRFLGETCPEPFKRLNIQLRKGNEEHLCNNGFKSQKINPCITCLGLLQTPNCNNTVDKVVEAVNSANYDSEDFNVALTLPVSFYLRAHALWVYLVTNFPEHCRNRLSLECVTVGVKDAWKYVITKLIEDRINKKFNAKSDFIVSITILYGQDQEECNCLLDMHPSIFSNTRRKKKGRRWAKGEEDSIFSRKNVEYALKQTPVEKFLQYCKVPPSIPSHFCTCGSVSLQHNSLFFAGRYNKYSRSLPQTPWIIKGERRMESSVQEMITMKIEAASRAEGSKFSSSGREDVDVRTLGQGRPFAIELLNPHKTIFSENEVREIENEVNMAGKNLIFIRDLQVVQKEELQILKDGEESKTKEYNALCIAWGVDVDKLKRLSESAPITISQKTPVRVLHRRPVATRPKTIHWLRTTVIDKPSEVHCSDEDVIYFRLQLNTQAGTYIKEFVHGDFGRTQPSIGDLLGGVVVDILALDVVNVEVDWPPRTLYT